MINPFRTLLELADRIERGPEILDRLDQQATHLLELAKRATERTWPPPFVAVLIEAKKASDGKPITAGISKYLRRSEHSCVLETHAQVALQDGKIVVFADLARVQCEGIFVGVDLLQLTVPGECPIAYFEAAHPGQMIRVAVRVRG